jgi:hypothetical protein
MAAVSYQQRLAQAIHRFSDKNHLKSLNTMRKAL